MANHVYIKQFRELRRMKQEHLAEAAGLSRSTISQMETGQRGYRRDSLEAVAEALDVPAAYLLLCDPHEDTTFWADFLTLNKRQRRRACAAMRDHATRHVIPHLRHNSRR